MKRILDLIDTGENEFLDFKKEISDHSKIAKTIVSFANRQGGTLLVGVNDNKTIHGVEPEEEKFMLHTAAEHYCEPPITLTIHEWKLKKKTVLEAKIPAGEHKPYYAKNEQNQWRVYIRVKDQSLMASKVVVDVLRRATTEENTLIKYTSKEKELLQYLAQNDKITIKEYCHMLNISRRRATRILVNLISAGVLRVHTTEKHDFYTLS